MAKAHTREIDHGGDASDIRSFTATHHYNEVRDPVALLRREILARKLARQRKKAAIARVRVVK